MSVTYNVALARDCIRKYGLEARRAAIYQHVGTMAHHESKKCYSALTYMYTANIQHQYCDWTAHL